MIKTIINYQMYIIIGILIFPIFACIIYFTKSLLDRAKFVRTLHNMKKPLMERINNPEAFYEKKKKKEAIGTIIFDIRNDIENLKQEITTAQKVHTEIKKIQQIEDDINIFYQNMQATKREEATSKESVEDIYKEAYRQQLEKQNTNTQQSDIQKQQAKIMNENIQKFLFVYKEKNKLLDEKERALDEKNKSIYILQQKLTEAEENIKKLANEEKNYPDKDKIIAAKTKIITILEEKLEEVAEKYKKILFLYKAHQEREKQKNETIEEKNEFILGLQSKIAGIEKKLEEMISINDHGKENFFHKKI